MVRVYIFLLQGWEEVIGMSVNFALMLTRLLDEDEEEDFDEDEDEDEDFEDDFEDEEEE
jgi:hypothetical protein